MIVIAFAAFLVVHGLIHLLGPVKAFGLADLPQLTHAIAPATGAAWLVASVLFLAAALMLFAAPRWWWIAGAAGVVVSMWVIAASWSDARFGAGANLIALAGVVFGFLIQGPASPRAAYEADVSRQPGAAAMPAVVADEDLEGMPPALRRYLTHVGVVGQPRVRSFRALVHGRIRSGPDAPWMPFTARQQNVLDPASRFFYMDAWRGALPVQVLHRYTGSTATMRAKVAGIATVADASGPAMTRAETVTLFNDMCLMAPAMLVEAPVAWEQTGEGLVHGTFTNAGHTVHAELIFDRDGRLQNFISDDRARATDDGGMAPARWSTPVDAYRQFGAVTIFSRGEGRWGEGSGSFAYIEFEVDAIEYNVR